MLALCLILQCKKQYLDISSNCVHGKYQHLSFNIVGAVKERRRKLAIITKISAIFLPYLSSYTNIWLVSFFDIKMRSLYAKFLLYNFTTEVGDRG